LRMGGYKTPFRMPWLAMEQSSNDKFQNRYPVWNHPAGSHFLFYKII